MFCLNINRSNSAEYVVSSVVLSYIRSFVRSLDSSFAARSCFRLLIGLQDVLFCLFVD